MHMLLLSNINTNSIGIVPELLLPQALLLENDAVGLPHGLGREQAIHALERDTLRLGHEEEDEEDGEDHHGGEEEVHAAARGTHVVEHLGREARDDEVLGMALVIYSASRVSVRGMAYPEPVACRCRGLTQGTGVVIEHFTVDDLGHD